MNIPEQWKAGLKDVLQRASVDAVFREKCLLEPLAAIQEATGLAAPAGIRFAEGEDPNAITLPAFGADPEEITDSEVLNQVAGGATYTLFSMNQNPNHCNF